MKTALLLIPALMLFACHNAKKEEDTSKARVLSKSIVIPVVRYGVEGFYTGDFVPETVKKDAYALTNKITICIDSLTDQEVFGRSIVAGNERTFHGTCQREDRSYTVDAREPGDDKYDGVFSFVIDEQQHNIKGTWQSFDSGLVATVRKYQLYERPYRYDPALKLPDELVSEPLYRSYIKGTDSMETLTDAAIRLNASTTLLHPHDLDNMYKADLEVLRNSIYARHGYSFKNPRMRTIFDALVPWYMPVATDVTAQLTDLERKNVALIKRYETHASKYYDSFGR